MSKCEQCGSENNVDDSHSWRLNLCQECRLDYYYHPKIVCLCGSTRFYEDFARINLEQTMQGNIVLSIGCDTHHVDSDYTEKQKQMLDRLHMHKIRMADEIIVINKGGYIGESTSREIHAAEIHGKRISYIYPI